MAVFIILSGVLFNKTPDESTQSTVIPQATDAEKMTKLKPDSPVLDNHPTPVSPKRPNENSPNLKKKVLRHLPK